LLSRTLDEMRRDLGIDRGPRAPVDAPRSIGIGDRVIVTALDQEGIVAEDLGESMLVTIGSMRMTVPKTELARRGGPAPRPKHDVAAGEARLAAATNAQSQLDVRGQRYAEAEPHVDQWIDQAVLLGHSPLRLVHGKGTGLLGRGLQAFLRADTRVTGVRYGNADEGGSGVTVFELR
jgi:DNA mismatch repair protein MutS2